MSNTLNYEPYPAASQPNITMDESYMTVNEWRVSKIT